MDVAPSADRVRKVINLLGSDIPGERAAAFARLEEMRERLPPNTLLSDYVGASGQEGDGWSFAPGLQRLKEMNRRLRIMVDIVERARADQKRARQELEVALAISAEQADRIKKLQVELDAERAKPRPRPQRWSEEEIVWLKHTYSFVVRVHQGSRRSGCIQALRDLVADFHAQFGSARSASAIKAKLRALRKLDPSIGSLFPRKPKSTSPEP